MLYTYITKKVLVLMGETLEKLNFWVTSHFRHIHIPDFLDDYSLWNSDISFLFIFHILPKFTHCWVSAYSSVIPLLWDPTMGVFRGGHRRQLPPTQRIVKEGFIGKMLKWVLFLCCVNKINTGEEIKILVI